MESIESLTARHDKLAEQLATLSSVTATPELEALRKRIVDLKMGRRDAERRRNADRSADLTKETETLEAERARILTERDVERTKVKIEMRAVRETIATEQVKQAAASFSKTPTEDLEKRGAELRAARKAGRLELRAIARELDSRRATERAEALLASLSDHEKQALMQQIKLGGIPSGERVRGTA